MRVIAGKFRSQPLLAPRGWKTRPTSDRLRETLFDILASRIEGSVVADLYAGTGAVGIEALSRGARQVYFAENARPALAALRENLGKLDIGSQAQVDPAGTLSLLKRLLKQEIRLDLVFLDPPFRDRAAYETTMQFLGEQPILSLDAIIVVEHSRREPAAAHRAMESYRTIAQGEAGLTFFRRTLKSAE